MYGQPEVRVVGRSHTDTGHGKTGGEVAVCGGGSEEEPAKYQRRHERRCAHFIKVEAGPHGVDTYCAAHLLALNAILYARLRAECPEKEQHFFFHAREFTGLPVQFRIVPDKIFVSRIFTFLGVPFSGSFSKVVRPRRQLHEANDDSESTLRVALGGLAERASLFFGPRGSRKVFVGAVAVDERVCGP